MGIIETVALSRGYLVTTVAEAKSITKKWLASIDLGNVVQLGLPEIDDRYHVWRVPLCNSLMDKLGELVLDAKTSEILEHKSSRPEMLEARLLLKKSLPSDKKKEKQLYRISTLRNTIGQGDCVKLMEEMPTHSVDLIFTSPPYFNARPEYTEYEEYEDYLTKMRQVIRGAHRVLSDGRFFVMNTAPVLLRRASRSQSSRRIAVPFDLHRLFIEEGYEFIDDIIWMKPEGAGWATGRGRRFAADRNPLQYKAVPVTEYVMVYRKKSDQLIDWHIRNHPDKELMAQSKIGDDYERTNVWKISPATSSKHPAAFPKDLASKVIQYYSFKGDVVFDPFAGSGTVGNAAAMLERRFILFELSEKYIDLMKSEASNWLGSRVNDVLWMNCEPPNTTMSLFQKKVTYEKKTK